MLLRSLKGYINQMMGYKDFRIFKIGILKHVESSFTLSYDLKGHHGIPITPELDVKLSRNGHLQGTCG